MRAAGAALDGAARAPASGSPSLQAIRSPMHEFQVIATFVVVAAIYFSLFLAAEKFWMK
jgi:hypothetical protein